MEKLEPKVNEVASTPSVLEHVHKIKKATPCVATASMPVNERAKSRLELQMSVHSIVLCYIQPLYYDMLISCEFCFETYLYSPFLILILLVNILTK